MPYFGCHLSPSAGYLAMGQTAVAIGADSFQFFTRNPRGSKAKPLDEADVAALQNYMKQMGFGPVVAHAPYTINACAAVERTREFARMTMEDDLRRMEYLPGNYYNFHPGSHVGQGMDAGIEAIADTLNAIMQPDQKTIVLLETMAGKGTEVGGRFEELREIIDRCRYPDRMGVCLDTCHVYDAGYDIVGDPDGVFTEFDRVLGLKRLRAVHVNDSKNPFGSHKDRHEKIGLGSLGAEAFKRIVRHEAVATLPLLLETPNELPGYAEEIGLLRSFVIP